MKPFAVLVYLVISAYLAEKQISEENGRGLEYEVNVTLTPYPPQVSYMENVSFFMFENFYVPVGLTLAEKFRCF